MAPGLEYIDPQWDLVYLTLAIGDGTKGPDPKFEKVP